MPPSYELAGGLSQNLTIVPKGVGLADLECANVVEEVECYRHALRVRANYPEAHNNLAISLKNVGDEEAARYHYQEALRLWPNYPEAHYNFAILLEMATDGAGAAMPRGR
jgi:Flp pilus assembly protein TadD